MQSNQLVNFANEFDFLPDLARVAAAAVLRRQPGPPAARAKALGAAGAAAAPLPFPLPCPAARPRRAAPRCPARGLGRSRRGPRTRSPAQGRPRARCSRRWQVGVTLGPALAPAARSAVRESRGAALRSALRPQSCGRCGTGAAIPGQSHRKSLGCGDRERPEPTPRRSAAPQPEAGGSSPERIRGSPARNPQPKVSSRSWGGSSSPGSLQRNNGEDCSGTRLRHGSLLVQCGFWGVSCTLTSTLLM